MENETHRDVFRQRWGTNVRPRDDTAVVVAGKLTSVKAADALLRSRSRHQPVHVRKACTVTASPLPRRGVGRL